MRRAWIPAAIQVIPDEFTASCFITTDKSSNQITGFYPGAMNYAHDFTSRFRPVRIQMAIVSPNDPKAMVSHVKECQELNVPYIYDPGQQVIFLKGRTANCGMTGSKAVIGNDYELELLITRPASALKNFWNLPNWSLSLRGEGGSTHDRRTHC